MLYFLWYEQWGVSCGFNATSVPDHCVCVCTLSSVPERERECAHVNGNGSTTLPPSLSSCLSSPTAPTWESLSQSSWLSLYLPLESAAHWLLTPSGPGTVLAQSNHIIKCSFCSACSDSKPWFWTLRTFLCEEAPTACPAYRNSVSVWVPSLWVAEIQPGIPSLVPKAFCLRSFFLLSCLLLCSPRSLSLGTTRSRASPTHPSEFPSQHGWTFCE